MKIVVILLLMLFLTGCSTKKQNDFKQIKKYLYEKGYQDLKNYNYLIVIGEWGCIGCNESFSNLMAQKLNTPKTLFIVTASGESFDVSKFRFNKNVIYDDTKKSKFETVFISKVFFLKDGKCNEILEINAENLRERLIYLNQKII